MTLIELAIVMAIMYVYKSADDPIAPEASWHQVIFLGMMVAYSTTWAARKLVSLIVSLIELIGRLCTLHRQ